MILEVSEEGGGSAALLLLSYSIPMCQSLVAAGRSQGTGRFGFKPITVVWPHCTCRGTGQGLNCAGASFSALNVLPFQSSLRGFCSPLSSVPPSPGL